LMFGFVRGLDSPISSGLIRILFIFPTANVNKPRSHAYQVAYSPPPYKTLINRPIKLLYNGQSQLGFFFIAKPGRLTLNRVLPKLRTNIPIRLQGIHVGAGYAAFQMSLNVLNVYRLPALLI